MEPLIPVKVLAWVWIATLVVLIWNQIDIRLCRAWLDLQRTARDGARLRGLPSPLNPRPAMASAKRLSSWIIVLQVMVSVCGIFVGLCLGQEDWNFMAFFGMNALTAIIAQGSIRDVQFLAKNLETSTQGKP